MSDQGESYPLGLLRSAMDEFVDRTRAVLETIGRLGSGALGAMPEPVSASVTRMLVSLQRLVEHAPPVTDQLNVIIEEIHAKRLTVQALQAELSAFDSQLDVLEKSLAPLETWNRQWLQLRRALDETLRTAAPAADAEPD